MGGRSVQVSNVESDMRWNTQFQQDAIFVQQLTQLDFLGEIQMASRIDQHLAREFR